MENLVAPSLGRAQYSCTIVGSSRSSFSRGYKWAPDGSCVLGNHEDGVMRIFRQGDSELADLSPCFCTPAAEYIYDFAWFPLMQSDIRASCCFITTSRDSPIHLWDSEEPRIRATYRPMNHLDELAHANSISFSSSGEQIFAGFERCIRTFDIHRPGRQTSERLLCTRKDKSGQRGLISTLAECPERPGLLAAGSYGRSIHFYTAGQRGCTLWCKDPEMGGVTQLTWLSDLEIASGHRKDGKIRVWDLRNLAEHVTSFDRPCNSNQRLAFGVSSSVLGAGGSDGSVFFFLAPDGGFIIEQVRVL
mmetsp:Transcript_125563/g.287681  ORF Transcript_125563/g.287681 Transcript_125563/m.287681 type:complete len:304 (+) Transcript_125563:27-938(+)